MWSETHCTMFDQYVYVDRNLCRCLLHCFKFGIDIPLQWLQTQAALIFNPYVRVLCKCQNIQENIEYNNKSLVNDLASIAKVSKC